MRRRTCRISPAKVKAIAADANYSNVTRGGSAAEPSSVTPAPVDLVFTAQNYHDLHNFPVDVVAFNKTILDSLKPGGLYVVLDHSAPAGSGLADTKTLHRIDADVVKQEVTAAGFEFVGGSDVLANAERHAHREGVRPVDSRQDRSVHIKIP